MNLGIGLSVTTTYQSIPAVGLDPEAAIAALFASGEEGAWYDPSDLSTMYQDAEGTTPVTAAGQPVGLILDKSKGGAGNDLIANGGFDSSSNWALVDTTISAGNLIFGTPGGYASQAISGDAGRYKLEVRKSVGFGGAGNLRLDFMNAGGSVKVVAIGSLTLTWGSGIVDVPGGFDEIRLVCGTADAYQIDSIVLQLAPGNHATQTTSAARPVLQTSGGLWYLDFDGVDDYLAAQYSTTLSDITRGVAYRAEADDDFVCDDYDDVNYFSIYLPPGTSNLRLGVNGAAGANIITAIGGWVLGDDEVAIATALSTKAIALQGSGNPASGTAPSAPANINGVTLGAAATGLLELNGRIYGFVDVNRTLTAGEITDLESYLADKSGVTL